MNLYFHGASGLRGGVRQARAIGALTLIEMVVAVGIGSLVLAIVGLLTVHALRSFAAMGNYASLDARNRLALDKITRDVRQATQVKNFYRDPSDPTTRWVRFATLDPAVALKYTWYADDRTLVCEKAGEEDTYLTECDEWDFALYQRTAQPDLTNVFFPSHESRRRLRSGGLQDRGHELEMLAHVAGKQVEHRERANRADGAAQQTLTLTLKTARQPGTSRREGSVLVITLLIALLLGMVLASYLLLVRAQSVSVARSQAWHAALAVAEAGVEEALAKLNAASFATTVTEAWSATNSLPGGAYAVSYAASVPPVIYSTGYATVPALSATLTRTIRVQTDLDPLFAVGAEVKGRINLNGHNLASDGYNANNPYYSNHGKYDPGGNTTDNGEIACGAGLDSVGSANIRGKLFLGAMATNRAESGFYVKDGIARDFNAEYSEVPAPVFGGIFRAPPASSNYTYALGGFNYRTNFLSGSVFVNVNAHAVLHLTGDAVITHLVISTNASLKIYAGGTTTTFLSQVSIWGDGTPGDFQYYGLGGNTNILVSGISNFIGTIYAPGACLTVEGGSGDTLDFQGALIVGEMNLKTHFKLHYDEFLRRAPEYAPARGFIVTNWAELPPP